MGLKIKVKFFFINKISILVQDTCTPLALKGSDLLCQAQSGMGKTAVFVFATLQLLDFEVNEVSALIMCPTRELAFQISKEYERFSMHMPLVKVNKLIYYIF